MEIHKKFRCVPDGSSAWEAEVSQYGVVLSNTYNRIRLTTAEFFRLAENVKLLQSQFGE